MVGVVWTESALRWLREIHDYIAADSDAAARRVVAGIVERTAQLAEFPESGQRIAMRGLRGVRWLLYGHYRIAYRYVESERVEIVGIYHGALHLARWLRGDLRHRE